MMFKNNKVFANEKIDYKKVDNAKKIITELQNDLDNYVKNGCGPFVACICDENGNMIAKASNSVVNEKCSNNHAEINVIRMAEEKFGTYNLAPYNLSIYITAEPCMMCLGAIMWSGIKNVYYGVPSNIVEKITGFDEGFKPNWHKEFKKRNIKVYGNIELELGIEKLENYVKTGKIVYKPNDAN